jgi:hypothetical protein
MTGNDASAGSLSFAFAFESIYRQVDFLFGVTPETTSVNVADSQLVARFGPWRVVTELSNVESARVTGPYRLIKTVGPARLGLLDRSLSFATTRRQGAEIRFREPVAGIEPTGRIRHPTLTVTVADVVGLVALLNQHTSERQPRSGPPRPSINEP